MNDVAGRLKSASGPATERSVSSDRTEIVLGTAQFGSRYGIANRTGCPSDIELEAILAVARAANVRQLDTARAYGDAEIRLAPFLDDGNFKIITKIAPLGVAEVGAPQAARRAEQSLQESLSRLRQHHVAVAMLHRAEDAMLDEVVRSLATFRDDGLVGAIGVSVSTPQEAVTCLRDERLTHLQIPFNLLDWRWAASNFVEELKNRPDVTVHARSAFLQGLLLSDARVWPSWADGAEDLSRSIAGLASTLPGGNKTLCLRYAASQPWIDAIVVGVDSAEQLEEITTDWTDEPLSPEMVKAVDLLAGRTPKRLLNPAEW